MKNIGKIVAKHNKYAAQDVVALMVGYLFVENENMAVATWVLAESELLFLIQKPLALD